MHLLELLFADLRHGVRALGRDKGFTATALLIFTLCLGANVALFAIVNAVLLRPLPFPRAAELVTVYNAYPKAGVNRAGSSIPHYIERRDGIAAFAEAAAVRESDRTIGESGSPERVATMSVTPSYFRVLGVSAALGRTFTDNEASSGNENVIILSNVLWREKFGADPKIIGVKVRMDGGTLATVVGVMPADFKFLSSQARLWMPLVFRDDDQKPDQRHSNGMTMIARLKPGVTLAVAQAQVDALNRSVASIDPYAKLVSDAGFYTKVVDLHEDHVEKTRPIVLLLQGAVLLLLLIGLVNLTNLMLVRATGRTKEMSVRQVLGASSAQLARQIVAETVTLSLAGGLFGLAAGWAGLRALTVLGLDQLPRSGEFALDATVCTVALTASVLVGLFLAAPVLWHTRDHSLATALSVESRGGTTSRATNRLRHALITAQIALAFVLLVSAGLLGLSFARVLAVKPGFQPDAVLTASVTLPRARFKEDATRIAFTERLLRELQGAPGVSAAGLSSMLPFSGNTDVNAVTVEGHTPAPGESLKAHYMGGVTGEYFKALGIPLREGRFIDADDTSRKARVCVVDENVARYYWPSGGALGSRVHQGVPKEGEEPFTVVGVVGAVKQEDLADQRGTGAIYLPYSHYASRDIAFAIRTTLAPESFGHTLRAALRRVDADLPLAELKTLSARIDDSLAQRRSPLWLAAIFAGLALLLVTVGLYGVLAYAVTQRRREIGVRMALGADPANIRSQFLGLGARLALAGVAIGALGAWWTGRAMHSLLFGVSAQQPLVFAGTVAVLGAVALTACFLPAARAARVTPMEALRGD